MSRFDAIQSSNIPHTNEESVRESAPIPSTLKEFQEATENALDFGEKHLGLWSADSTERSTIAFEEWVDITAELEETFFEMNSGILGKQLLTFASLSDAELVHENIRREIEAVLMQTAPLAHRINPLIDRLCAVNPTMSRADVIATLREGEIAQTQIVDYISKQPHRKSLLGILHNLSERLTKIALEEKRRPSAELTLWDFNQQEKKKLAPVIVLSDPFADDAASQEYWKDRADESIIKRSEQKTQSIIYELENLRQVIEKDEEKKELVAALNVIESWLESNMILYRDGGETDFSLYHLGMETPTDIDAILGSLDTIKRDNPEFFVQLTGINPAGGKSPYFGSFIHKALFNTQKAVDEAEGSASNLFLKSSLQQLLMINGHVQRWNFDETISEESLKALAQKMEERVAAETTETGKNQVRMLWATMLVKPTIEVEVKRQLEAMKEVNLKELKSELMKRLDDHDHPMLVLKAVSLLPLIAFRDPDIKHRLIAVFGEDVVKEPAQLQEQCKKEDERVIRAVFNQIPIFDYENAKITNFFSTVVQEVMRRESRVNRLRRLVGGEDTKPALDFIQNIFYHRVITGKIAFAGLQTDEQRALVKNLEKEFSAETNTLRDLDDPRRAPDVLPIDKPLWEAFMIVKGQKNYRSWKEKREYSEQEKDKERDVALASVFLTLNNEEDSRRLRENFDAFVLRKKDAGNIVKLMFDHLDNSLTMSYEKFDFLWQHAGKFEENDLLALLKSLPVDDEVLRDIVKHAKEWYSPAFHNYFRTLKLNAALVKEWVLDERAGLGIMWTEDSVLNFARIPAFRDPFVQNAKDIFTQYPDLPKKLYGDWGARMVERFDLAGEHQDILRRMFEICPKNGGDDVKERWHILQGMLRVTEPRYDGERFNPQIQEMGPVLRRIIESFEKEFPEVTHG